MPSDLANDDDDDDVAAAAAAIASTEQLLDIFFPFHFIFFHQTSDGVLSIKTDRH